MVLVVNNINTDLACTNLLLDKLALMTLSGAARLVYLLLVQCKGVAHHQWWVGVSLAKYKLL